MSVAPKTLEQKLDEALTRIERLEQTQVEEQAVSGWTYLVTRRHSWRRQPCIKGRNMTVGHVMSLMQANGLTVEQAAVDLNLPINANREAVRYVELHRDLIELEALEERRRLAEKGVIA